MIWLSLHLLLATTVVLQIGKTSCALLLPPPLVTSSTHRFIALPLTKSPTVWIEEAEDGFVDEEENLEPGEVCLKSVKSFASGVPTPEGASRDNRAATGNVDIRLDREFGKDDEKNLEDNGRRFLSAGALVQRPRYDWEPNTSTNLNTTGICDAWIADSLLQEGGPNLQLQGALLVLDDLFLHHLQREREHHRSILEHEAKNSGNGETTDHENHLCDPTDHCENDSWAIRALRNFVVHCGDDDEDLEGESNPGDRPWRSTFHVAASEMAASMRGWVPLRHMVRIDSIYDAGYYDGDTTGMVLDPLLGMNRYSTAAAAAAAEDSNESLAAAASIIANLLPSQDTVARHTTKRFTINRRREASE